MQKKPIWAPRYWGSAATDCRVSAVARNNRSYIWRLFWIASAASSAGRVNTTWKYSQSNSSAAFSLTIWPWTKIGTWDNGGPHTSCMRCVHGRIDRSAPDGHPARLCGSVRWHAIHAFVPQTETWHALGETSRHGRALCQRLPVQAARKRAPSVGDPGWG